MSRISEGGGLHGVNWSVERGLVSPDIAEQAAREILDGIATCNPMIAFDHRQLEAGYTGYKMTGLQGLKEKDITDSGFGFPALLVVREALTPFKDPKLLKDRKSKHYDEGFINITERAGSVPTHSDSEPWSLVFVSLRGIARARFKHYSEKGFSPVTLAPGDAIRVTNPKRRRERPRHDITNLSPFARVSYGEYTTQRDR